jgi:hydroxyacylglutathione hydrolase
VHVEVILTEALGDRSYLVHDGTSAVVVDPQRDIDRVEKMLADLGVRCAVVVETHIHNDYVTGGTSCRCATGAHTW